MIFLCVLIVEMRKLTLLFVLLISSIGFAQDINVKGTVLDGAYGEEPLAFASVKVKGLDINAETSMDGAFEFRLLEGNYTFIVDFIGYNPVEIEDVVVTNNMVTLNPVVLRALKPGYDLVSAADGE